MDDDFAGNPSDEQAHSDTPSTRVGSSPLPSGTVTFLFTDIEGSTKLLEQLHSRYIQLLADHHKLLREVFQNWHGHEVDTEGDAFFVAFGRASDAIACVIEAQQSLNGFAWPNGVNVRVRMGLHTGEPLVGYTGYIGMDVHRAARIAHVGYGGQVLLSQTTRDLVYQDLPAGTRLRDLGAHLLKDLRFPQQIYQLDIPGLISEFPPLKSLDKLEKEEEPPAPGNSPYMGLQYFDEKDAEWFFGRQAVTDRLVQAATSSRFLAIVGASGSGKSSVVRAGLIPAMKVSHKPAWQVSIITPSSHPLDSLALCLTSDIDPISAASSLIDGMQANPRSLYLYCQKLFSKLTDIRPLLVIDQFEELFSLCRSETERQAFVNNLLYAVGIPDGALTVVITLRADFYEHLAQYTGLRELVSAHQVYIGVMNAGELRLAIEEPAKRGGWELSPGLVDLILGDLGAGPNHQPEPGALPLLSHALLETWKRRRGCTLNLKAYTEAGGVQGAIAKTAESVFFRDLDPAQQAIAKSIFLRLTELGEGTQDTRRRISIHELIPPGPAIDAEQIQQVLLKLADARLIITGEGTVEVAHEALIREWPTLRDWLASDREGLRLHRHLTESAQEWELLERDPGALYRGTRLTQATEWAMANPRALNLQEQEYLEASQAAAEREQSERETQHQRELEAAHKLAETERQRAEDQARSTKRLRLRAMLLAGVLVLALALAGAAVVFGRQADANARLANQNMAAAQTAEGQALGQQATAVSEALQRATAEAVAEQERVTAEEQAKLATSRYLTSAALNNLNINSQLSAHLALQALQTYPTLEAVNTLHLSIPGLRLLSSTTISNSIPGWSYWITDYGKILFIGTPEGIRLKNWTTGEETMFAAGEVIDTLIPTQDGLWLFAGRLNSPDFFGNIYNVETRKKVYSINLSYPNLISMGLIPPSTTHPPLAYRGNSDNNGTIFSFYDVITGEEWLVENEHTGKADAIGSADGKLMATIDVYGKVVVWNLDTRQKIGQFVMQGINISDAVYAAFSPDNAYLSIVKDNTVISEWNITDLSSGPSLEHEFRSNGKLTNIVYSPDGTQLAAGGSDGLIRVWSTQSGELQLILSGQVGLSWIYCFNQQGTRLYTMSIDSTIKEWDLTLAHELMTLPGRLGRSSFSPDRTKLAFSDADGTLFVVDSSTGNPIISWQAASNEIDDIAWSPDGTRLATSSGTAFITQVARIDNSAKVWDPSNGNLLKEISGDEYSGFPFVAWSPDGSRLVTACWQKGIIFIWDTNTWELANTLPEVSDGILALSYSPDGQKLAFSSYIGMSVVDLITGSEIYTETLNHNPFSLTFSPDGHKLAVGLSTGKILIYKVLTDTVTLDEEFSNIDSMVMSLAFNSDGSMLAGGDFAGTVRVWEINTHNFKLDINTYNKPVLNVTFSPDSQYLLASIENELTYYYTLSIEELLNLARSRIILPLTSDQCWEYLKTETCPPWP